MIPLCRERIECFELMISSSPENKYKFPHTKRRQRLLLGCSTEALSHLYPNPLLLFSLCVCLCVSMYAYLCLHVFMYGHMYEHVCIWKPKVDIGILPQ